MKVADLEVMIVENPPPSYGGGHFAFVIVTTDDGIEGVGEVYSLPFAGATIESMIADVFERKLLGRDPHATERLWRDVYAMGYRLRSDPTVMAILSGLEMACWDIVGKAVDRPIYDLLGGRVHERLRVYTYLYPTDADSRDVHRDPDLAAERAVAYAEDGFTAIKFDPVVEYTALDPSQPTAAILDHAERYVRAIRDAVGPEVDLLVGTHGQFSASGAARLARRLEPFDPLWFEEPVPPENIDAMAQVARRTSIPIATGERLSTKYEFREVLTRQAASIIQPNLGRVGGILEAKKVAALAEAHYAHVAPHLYNGPVGLAASLQLDACTPNFLVQEVIGYGADFHGDLVGGALVVEDGYAEIPTAPGLGITLDRAVVEGARSSPTRLHLDVHPRDD